jgi:hypothetical protein
MIRQTDITVIVICVSSVCAARFRLDTGSKSVGMFRLPADQTIALGHSFSCDARHTKKGEDITAAFVVCDQNGQQLAYVYCEEEPGRRSVAKLLKEG